MLDVVGLGTITETVAITGECCDSAPSAGGRVELHAVVGSDEAPRASGFRRELRTHGEVVKPPAHDTPAMVRAIGKAASARELDAVKGPCDSGHLWRRQCGDAPTGRRRAKDAR